MPVVKFFLGLDLEEILSFLDEPWIAKLSSFCPVLLIYKFVKRYVYVLRYMWFWEIRK